MLLVDSLHVYYDGIHSLKGVSLQINKGEIVTIIGSNGAGKSTLLNTLSGFVKPKKGTIYFNKRSLDLKPHVIVQNGICHVPEGRLIFANLTVEDNLLLGAYLRTNKRQIADDRERVYHLFPLLKQRNKQMAGTLSGGEQQMLAMGRGLMSNPELILLDEPSLGLAPQLVQIIFDIIIEIRSLGKTILLVEQNAWKALRTADRAYVLEQGRIIAQGPASEIEKDPKVAQAYLGVKSEYE